MFRTAIAVWAACALTTMYAQTDPGVRPGPPSAGRPLPQLTPVENSEFRQGAQRFQQLVSVSGTEPGATDVGLGPRFNLNSCAGCHAQPAPGGTSPSTNPQIAMATDFGAHNVVPSFIQLSGPVRAARFLNNPDGTPDGSVHDLFVISGRSDAGNCAISQPDFSTAVAQNNIAFRIPTPLFGLGLMEMIPDGAIFSNQAANAQAKAALGITGHANVSANDATVTRFGWKAQNKSLEIFAGEAYNVEIGVTNNLFPSERDTTPACQLNAVPEDQPDFTAATPVAAVSDVTAFSEFMRWLAPPAPPQPNPSAQNGQQLFAQIGCALCHTPVMNTGNSTSAALNNKPVQLFSDLLVHHMGANLADGIVQGTAQGDEFRTAPLWGLGQRIFFLHDGRTTDLLQAIQAHASAGSEASAVVAAFNSLPTNAIQDVLNFLRLL
jgi:CxxC motif-containing protein (DUF1111 family)